MVQCKDFDKRCGYFPQKKPISDHRNYRECGSITEHFLKTTFINNSFSISRSKKTKVVIFYQYSKRGPVTGLFIIIGGLLKKVQF